MRKTNQLRSIALAAAALVAGIPAHAVTFETGESDVKVRWDNTVKYTAGWRVASPDEFVANGNGQQPNTDFGDLAHDKGLINNRLDLLSELDVSYRNLGLRLSGAAWYDGHYDRKTNDFASRFGPVPNTVAAAQGGPNNAYTSADRNTMARKAELLDAFVFGRFNLGEESNATVRLGSHTLLYGETLFLGANGIAAAQGPVDLIKAFSLPNAQFKEIARPIGQLSTDIQVNSTTSVGAYYQYKYKPIRFPTAGSYFSPAEFLMDGGDFLALPPQLGGPAVRQAHLRGSNSGNYGARVKFKSGDTDYGLYAARYDDKAPIGVVDITNHTYRAMYGKGIQTLGGSVSTVVGETNVALEASVRRNVPLAVAGDLFFATSATDNDRNTAYSRGKTFHLNASAITVLPANALWEGASFVGEFGFNRLLSVSTPGNSINPINGTHTRDHGAVRLVFTPEYFQVLPGVDLQVPIGLGYGLFGRSAFFQMAPDQGGDLSIGLNAEINKTWKASLNYTNYFGKKGPAASLDGRGASYKQYYADRDFVTFSVQRTF